MMKVEQTIRYEGWDVKRLIGSGSYGEVYEISKKGNLDISSALKIIRIPQSINEINLVKSEFGDDDEASLKEYFDNRKAKVLEEIKIMSQIKGCTNIVSYEDYEVRKQSNGIGWDILLRMELLNPIDSVIKDTNQIIQLGIDICKALEVCRDNEIIHRDIKPMNILYSPKLKAFKLADFGIAKMRSESVENYAGTIAGTDNYLAPEVLGKEGYDYRVDIYSLGLVMYRLLNNNKCAFCSTVADFVEANERRWHGDEIPPPYFDQPELSAIVLKACSYKPEDRYHSPTDMRRKLESLLGCTSPIIIRKEKKKDFFKKEEDSCVGNSYRGAKGKLYNKKVSKMGTRGLFNDDEPGNNSVTKYDDSLVPSYERLKPSEIPQELEKEQRTKPRNKNLKHTYGKDIKKRILLVVLVVIIIFVVVVSVMSFRNASLSNSDRSSFTANSEKEYSGLQEELEALLKGTDESDMKAAYKIIKDSVSNGQNMDSYIREFVHACENELVYESIRKRVVAVMELLSDSVESNEDLYKETIQMFCDINHLEDAEVILMDLRGKGEQGAKLADELSLE